jgi:hypothetical protein
MGPLEWKPLARNNSALERGCRHVITGNLNKTSTSKQCPFSPDNNLQKHCDSTYIIIDKKYMSFCKHQRQNNIHFVLAMSRKNCTSM